MPVIINGHGASDTQKVLLEASGYKTVPSNKRNFTWAPRAHLAGVKYQSQLVFTLIDSVAFHGSHSINIHNPV